MGRRHRTAINLALIAIGILATISNAIRPDPLLEALCGGAAIVVMARIARIISRNSDDDEEF